jgi:hypothetical protein
MHAGASSAVDGWFAAWSEPDTAKREALLDRLATEDVRFRDRFSLIDWPVGSCARTWPRCTSSCPACASSARGDSATARARCWPIGSRAAADGTERGRGTNVFALGHHGRIESVTGFWNPPKARALAFLRIAPSEIMGSLQAPRSGTRLAHER